MNIISLAELENFDGGASAGWPRRRFRCPLPGPCTGKEKRSLDADVARGCWTCHRCNRGGKLGEEAREGAFRASAPPKVIKPSKTWQEVEARSNLAPLEGTPGQSYLEQRGIPLEIAVACGVRFAGCWFGRASVMFDVTGPNGAKIAVQGRAISGDAKITVGPKKLGVFATPYALQGDFAITEAPIDALSLLLFDIPAAATLGSGLPLWLSGAASGKTILIASDNDEQGETDFLNWKPLLEKAGARVKRYAPPHAKDWNDELRLRK